MRWASQKVKGVLTMSTASKPDRGSLVVFIVVAVILVAALSGGLYLAKQRGKVAVQPSPGPAPEAPAAGSPGGQQPGTAAPPSTGSASPPSASAPSTPAAPSGGSTAPSVPATGAQSLPATGPADSPLLASAGLVGLALSVAYYLRSRDQLRRSYI